MAYYGESDKDEMFETVQRWVEEFGLKRTLTTLLDVIRQLTEWHMQEK